MNEIHDYIYDKSYCVERAKKGPFVDYDYVSSLLNFTFKDLTMPDPRVCVWGNYRPIVASHDMMSVLNNIHGGAKRLGEIDTKYKLWSTENPISYTDVAQGFTVGNCYLHAGFSVMASIKGLVESIFIFKDGENDGLLSKNGIYCVNIYIGGIPTEMCVDDTMPIDKEGKLLFSQPHPSTNNCWSVILEKIWAKISVNYERTCAGW